MSEVDDGPAASSTGMDFLAKNTVALPRGSLVLWMVTAIEHLEGAVNAVASSDVDGLRREFEAFVLTAKAAAETLGPAVIQMRQERL